MFGNRKLLIDKELNEQLNKFKEILFIHFEEVLIQKNIGANNKTKRQKSAQEKMAVEYQLIIGKAKTPLDGYKAVISWCRNKADDGLDVVREAFEKQHRMLAMNTPANSHNLLSQYFQTADRHAVATINGLIHRKDHIKMRQKEEKAEHTETLLDARKLYDLCKSDVSRVVSSSLSLQDNPVQFNKALKKVKRIANDIDLPAAPPVQALLREDHSIKNLSLTEYKQQDALAELEHHIAAYREELANENPVKRFLKSIFSPSRTRRLAALDDYNKTVKKEPSLADKYKAACIWLEKQSLDEDFVDGNKSRLFNMCLEPLATSRFEEVFTTVTPNYLVRAAQVKRHQIRIEKSNQTHRQTLLDIQRGIVHVNDRHQQLQTMAVKFKDHVNKINLSSPTAVIHTNRTVLCESQEAMREVINGLPEKIVKAQQLALVIAAIDRHMDKKAFYELHLPERLAECCDEPKAMGVIHTQVQKQLELAKKVGGTGNDFNFIGMEVLSWLIEVAGADIQKRELTSIQEMAVQRAHQSHDVRLDEKVAVMVQTLEKELITGKLHKKLDQQTFKADTIQTADLARRKKDKRLEEFVAKVMGGSLSATFLNAESVNKRTVAQTLSPQQATIFITHFGTHDQQKAWHEKFLPQLISRVEGVTATFVPRG